jgi:hypothetical protein
LAFPKHLKNQATSTIGSADLGLSRQNMDRTDSKSDTPMARGCSLDVPELRRHLKMRRLIAAPVLQPLLSTLDQQLKGWETGGNRAHLGPGIERTIRTIENFRQPSEERA